MLLSYDPDIVNAKKKTYLDYTQINYKKKKENNQSFNYKKLN